jgi:stearoyl-CoA desaturase (delta-9 desaturase)
MTISNTIATSDDTRPQRSSTKRWFRYIAAWFDSAQLPPPAPGVDTTVVEWPRAVPFLALHIACLLVFLTGASLVAIGVCLAAYILRMFAITGWYHRYFSHRTFKTSRTMQFVWALIGGMSAQRGALWWAAHHRGHHLHSDQDGDAHSPHDRGFWYSHMLWFMTRKNVDTDLGAIKDLAKYPELRFLNRFDVLPPILFAVMTFGLGVLLAAIAPGLGTNGLQMFVWGFLISTVLLFHATASINSFGHLVGGQRYETGDTSRNNAFLALITLGEGWHNNHHFYPVSTRQGFKWWEFDLAWYGLLAMQGLGLVRNIRPVPEHVMDGHRVPPRVRDGEAPPEPSWARRPALSLGPTEALPRAGAH